MAEKPNLDREAWPIGTRVQAWSGLRPESQPVVGTIIGHTPKMIRVRPDGWTSYITRLPRYVKIVAPASSRFGSPEGDS